MADLVSEELSRRDRSRAAFDAARGGRSRFARMLSSNDPSPSEQLSREKFDYEKQRDAANDAFKAVQATQRAEMATGRAEIADQRLKLSQEQYDIQQKQYELKKAQDDKELAAKTFQLDKAIQATDESTAFIKEFGAIDHRDEDYEHKVMQLGSKYSLGVQDPHVQEWIAKSNGYRENYLKNKAEQDKLQAAKDLVQAKKDEVAAAGLVPSGATVDGMQYTAPKVVTPAVSKTRIETDATGKVIKKVVEGPTREKIQTAPVVVAPTGGLITPAAAPVVVAPPLSKEDLAKKALADPASNDLHKAAARKILGITDGQ